jgi:hypothetical protein
MPDDTIEQVDTATDGAAAAADPGGAPGDGALRERVLELERELAGAHEALDSVERRHAIDLALLEAEAVDLETARLLTELAVGRMASPDVGAAVSEVRRSKPFLFRAPAGRGTAREPGAAMGPRGVVGAVDRAGAAAEDAAASGDRVALLRYLRARRGRG